MVDLLLHVNARDGEPFRSLSDLPDEEALALMRTSWMESALDAATQATTCQLEVPLDLFSPDDISFKARLCRRLPPLTR